MTEISRPWNGTTVGDAGPYSDQNWADAWSNMLGAVNANSGPLRMTNTPPEDTLEVTATSPASAAVLMTPGAALVDGTLYMNDADLTHALTANGSGNPRFDLLVLQKDFTLQTVRAVIKQGTPGASPAPPGLTQTPGVMWEIPLADIFLASGYVSVSDDNITPRHEFANVPDGMFLDGVLNNSGGNLLTGDVVVWDSTADRAVTGTTMANNPNIAGVWVGRKSNALYGRVRTGGIGWVRTNATVSRGQLLSTSTTTKQAQVAGVNSFARVLKARAGSGLALCELFSRPIQSYALLRDEKAQNTAGGGFTSGAWQVRILNTEVTDDGENVMLAANQITLVAGTYQYRASALGYLVDRHQIRLQNVSDTVTIEEGTSSMASSVDLAMSRSFISGRFTIAAGKLLELQHRCQTTRALDGFGLAANHTTEVYAEIEFWRLS